MTSFHDILFPLDIAMHARGGPERKTEVIVLGSGREQRNTRWQHSRRKYDAGYGIKSLIALANVVSFFEERCGMLYGFRWRDRMDWKSGPINLPPSPQDQVIGEGDGVRTQFQLVKTYGGSFAPYVRSITKPVEGSVRIAVDGVEKHVTTDSSTGVITFAPDQAPALKTQITAGFSFDVPVRFDTDYLEIDLAAFEAGIIPKIPLVELKETN